MPSNTTVFKALIPYFNTLWSETRVLEAQPGRCQQGKAELGKDNSILLLIIYKAVTQKEFEFGGNFQ